MTAIFDDNLNEYAAYQQGAIRKNEPDIYRHIPDAMDGKNGYRDGIGFRLLRMQ